jgi:hypothetical protein
MFTVINVYLFSFLKNNNCIKVIVSLVVFLILILQLFIPINDRVLHKKYAPEQFIDKNMKIISHGENF